mmetsp:Transcript_10424/g.38722  ORF Transcript_10424/g.38722 Transcript_10424/m.38722 type:complete len:293 (+) Transcript_10424:3419-4297(+)
MVCDAVVSWSPAPFGALILYNTAFFVSAPSIPVSMHFRCSQSTNRHTTCSLGELLLHTILDDAKIHHLDSNSLQHLVNVTIFLRLARLTLQFGKGGDTSVEILAGHLHLARDHFAIRRLALSLLHLLLSLRGTCNLLLEQSIQLGDIHVGIDNLGLFRILVFLELLFVLCLQLVQPFDIISQFNVVHLEGIVAFHEHFDLIEILLASSLGHHILQVFVIPLVPLLQSKPLTLHLLLFLGNGTQQIIYLRGNVHPSLHLGSLLLLGSLLSHFILSDKLVEFHDIPSESIPFIS